jgi:hypothetical protein
LQLPSHQRWAQTAVLLLALVHGSRLVLLLPGSLCVQCHLLLLPLA